MKKNIYLIVTALLCTIGCQVQEQMDPEETYSDPECIYAQMENLSGNDTRTYIGAEDKVYFHQEDEINLFNGNTSSKKYRLAAGAGTTSGTFNKMPVDGSSAGETIEAVVAYYPYTQGIALSSTDKGFTLSGIELPSTQYYDHDNVISQNIFPMVSVNAANAETIKFKNLCGVLELNIQGTGTIHKITLKGKNNEQICGNAKVTAKLNEDPSITMQNPQNGQTQEITLDCGENGVALDRNKPKPFRIVIPPVEFSKGFEINITNIKNETILKTKNSPAEKINRSEIREMKSFQYDHPDLRINVNGIDLDMVFVKAGTFWMGIQGTDPNGLNYDEDYNCEKLRNNCDQPVHEVELTEDYYISQYEVTKELWNIVMSQDSKSISNNDNQCAVNNISWNEANTFITNLNSKTGKTFSLPTEAQWEYAARGGQKSQSKQHPGSKDFKYSGSDVKIDVAWSNDTDGGPHPVGEKLPNELGIYDMSGNVGEWTSDNRYEYLPDHIENPHVPVGICPILRGGAYHMNNACRVAFRNLDDRFKTNVGYNGSGIRIVILKSDVQ